MKLHNLLLTAALFLSAGVAFAGHTIDTDKYNISNFTWTNNTGDQTIRVELKQYGNQEGFKYYVYDADAYDNNQIKNGAWGKYASNNKGKVWELKTGVNEIELPEGVTRVGVFALTQKVYSGDNASSQFLFYRDTDSKYLDRKVSFGKLDDNGPGNDRSADVIFGAPLPTPVVTLLIALAIGAGFVMYRSRKQQAEA